MEWPPTQFVRVPPYEIRVFLTNLIFFQHNEIILRGKKRTLIFQIYNWEKSSFFNALVCVFSKISANTWQIYAPPLGLIGLRISFLEVIHILKFKGGVVHLEGLDLIIFFLLIDSLCLEGREEKRA